MSWLASVGWVWIILAGITVLHSCTRSHARMEIEQARQRGSTGSLIFNRIAGGDAHLGHRILVMFWTALSLPISLGIWIMAFVGGTILWAVSLLF